MTGNRKNTTEH